MKCKETEDERTSSPKVIYFCFLPNTLYSKLYLLYVYLKNVIKDLKPGINISFEALVGSLNFDCWAVNLDMMYIYQNNASIDNWGNVIGKTVDELDINSETKSIWKIQLKKVFKGKTFVNDYAVEESEKHFHSTITPLIEKNVCIGALGATIEVTDYKNNQIKLAKKKQELERLNTALHVLLDKREKDKTSHEQNLVKKIQFELLPLIDRIKKTCNGNNKSIIETLEIKLRQLQLVSSDNLVDILSHTELQIANLIREGKPSKEIADILNVSKCTIDTHRDNIRRKLGLKNTSQNLKDIL